MAGKAKKFVLNQGKRKLKFVLEPLKLQLRSKKYPAQARCSHGIFLIS